MGQAKHCHLRPIYTRRYSGGIPRGIAHLSNQRTFIYFCVTPERYASGIALDRFQSDIPAGSRSPAVHLTNQRFCFAVVMPQPVTTLAGSDAYLGHQKQDVGEFNPSRRRARDVVCALPQGIHCAIHARVSGILHGDPSSVVSRAPRHVVGVNSFAYRSPFPASLTPDVNATAGGKIPRRTISRRNTA